MKTRIAITILLFALFAVSAGQNAAAEPVNSPDCETESCVFFPALSKPLPPQIAYLSLDSQSHMYIYRLNTDGSGQTKVAGQL